MYRGNANKRGAPYRPRGRGRGLRPTGSLQEPDAHLRRLLMAPVPADFQLRHQQLQALQTSTGGSYNQNMTSVPTQSSVPPFPLNSGATASSSTTIPIGGPIRARFSQQTPANGIPTGEVRSNPLFDGFGFAAPPEGEPAQQALEPIPGTSRTTTANHSMNTKKPHNAEYSDISDDEDLPKESPAALSTTKNVPVPPVAEASKLKPHKKFNYKAWNSAKKVEKSDETAEEKPSTSAEMKLEEMLDNLRLSPYITREQAASRLRELGNKDEVQREIDSFAAIIYCRNLTGPMRLNQVPHLTQTSDTNSGGNNGNHGGTSAQENAVTIQGTRKLEGATEHQKKEDNVVTEQKN